MVGEHESLHQVLDIDLGEVALEATAGLKVHHHTLLALAVIRDGVACDRGHLHAKVPIAVGLQWKPVGGHRQHADVYGFLRVPEASCAAVNLLV